jgi:hypothetical protein
MARIVVDNTSSEARQRQLTEPKLPSNVFAHTPAHICVKIAHELGRCACGATYTLPHGRKAFAHFDERVRLRAIYTNFASLSATQF